MAEILFKCDKKRVEDRILLAKLDLIEQNHRPSRLFNDSCECFKKPYREHIYKLRREVLDRH